MNNETRKTFVLVLAIFIIISAFVPSLNPLPTLNNATSETPLIQLYTDSINSSNSSDVEDWFDGTSGISGYAEEYMLPLDNLIFILIGVLLVLFIISVIILITSKKSGVFGFIRITAILNTLTYAALIALTLYQRNKLSDDTWGLSDSFIKISPSTGAYVGFIVSLVLAFIARRERIQIADRHAYNTQSRQNPPIIKQQIPEEIQTQTNAYQHIQATNNIQEQILCQSCGKSCDKGTMFCNECGNRLSFNNMFCHNCGSKVNEGASFCQSCGERLSNNATEI